MHGPDFEKRIGIAVEYCTSCGSTMSSDGCSNPVCWKTRPLYPLQEALRAKALNDYYGTTNYSRSQQQLYGTKH